MLVLGKLVELITTSISKERGTNTKTMDIENRVMEILWPEGGIHLAEVTLTATSTHLPLN
jgi:hypothetical protein